MKLGIIGWYGHNNYGDDRILYCIKRFFADYDLLVSTSWTDARSRIGELNKCDYILIGGGGLILRNIGNETQLISELKRPFGLLGVSIEARHRSMEEFFGRIKQKSEFIMVRDQQSKRHLDNHYKVIVGPDITFLYPFDVVKEGKGDICGLNLREWYYWKSTLYGDYYNLMLKIDNRFPWIRSIYPFAKWDTNNVVRMVKKKFKETLPIPFYFEEDGQNDVKVLSEFFQNVPPMFDIKLYSNIRYLIGMRYHSIVFATQCGIPFVSLSYQPKNVNFCLEMGLDVISADIYQLGNLEEKIEYTRDHYRVLRECLLSYRAQNIQDIRYIFQSLLHLIK